MSAFTEGCYRGSSAASHTLTAFAYNALKSHQADAQLISELAVGWSKPFLMRQWEHLAEKQFPLENRLLVVAALRMITKNYLRLPREQQGRAHEVRMYCMVVTVCCFSCLVATLGPGGWVCPAIDCEAEAGCGCRPRRSQRALPLLARLFLRWLRRSVSMPCVDTGGK